MVVIVEDFEVREKRWAWSVEIELNHLCGAP